MKNQIKVAVVKPQMKLFSLSMKLDDYKAVDQPLNATKAKRVSHAFGGYITNKDSQERVLDGKDMQRNSMIEKVGLLKNDVRPSKLIPDSDSKSLGDSDVKVLWKPSSCN